MNLESATYRLLISPSDIVKMDANYYKNQLVKHIGTYPSMSSPAHLTLAGFIMSVKKELVLIRSLEVAAAEESATQFTVNGFRAFESSGTVFLHVEEKENFARMSRNLLRKSVIASLPSKLRGITTTPHVTIGRNLKSEFERAYKLLCHQQYFQNFTTTSVHLFRQDNAYEKYKPIQEFPFLARPAAQLSMF